MKAVNIIISFGETLFEIVDGNKHVGYFKTSGEFKKSEFLEILYKNCPKAYTPCSKLEETFFIDYDNF